MLAVDAGRIIGMKKLFRKKMKDGEALTQSGAASQGGTAGAGSSAAATHEGSGADSRETGDQFDQQVAALLSEDSSKPKKKKRWRRIALVLVLLVVVILILRACFGGSANVGIPVVTEGLSRDSIQEKLSVSGPVSGTDSADVMSNLHAEVLQVLVKEGDRVEKGQALAMLDEHDALQAVQMAENQVALAEANKEEALKQAVAGYAQAKQALNSAQADFDRKQVLFEAGDISKAEYERAQATLGDAKAGIGAYRVEGGQVILGDSYDLQIENAKFDLEKARDSYAQTTVTAPISGIVTRVNTKVGQFADKVDSTITSMFTIENLDTLELEIRISEYSIGKVSVGQKATISADIMGDKQVEGEVIAISPTGEEKGGGSSERVIPTKIRVDSQDSGLISGITAKAEIVLSEAKDVYVVPLSALMTNPDGSTSIAFVRDGMVHMSSVTTGVENDISVEVTPVDAADPNFAEGSRYITTPDAMLIAEGVMVTDASAMMPQ